MLIKDIKFVTKTARGSGVVTFMNPDFHLPSYCFG